MRYEPFPWNSSRRLYAMTNQSETLFKIGEYVHGHQSDFENGQTLPLTSYPASKHLAMQDA